MIERKGLLPIPEFSLNTAQLPVEMNVLRSQQTVVSKWHGGCYGIWKHQTARQLLQVVSQKQEQKQENFWRGDG